MAALSRTIDAQNNLQEQFDRHTDSVNARQEMLIGEIRDLRAALVPRAEYQARWEMLEEKLNLLEPKLKSARTPKP